jgi:protein-S-isoprenylcysteine O-methyltransferase Ste14
MVVIVLALRENAFAAPVVEHQEGRHQRVINSEVYPAVRHPMYTGFVRFILGMCLWPGHTPWLCWRSSQSEQLPSGSSLKSDS